MSFNQFPFLLVRRLENTEKGQLYANWLINYTASYSAMVIDCFHLRAMNSMFKAGKCDR